MYHRLGSSALQCFENWIPPSSRFGKLQVDSMAFENSSDSSAASQSVELGVSFLFASCIM
jgi:hypothetical protein